jgi:hypothetical protein
MEVTFGSWCAEVIILLASWVVKVVRSGMIHRSPDVYLRDMRLRVASVKEVGSELSEHLDTCMCAYLAVVYRHSLLPPQGTTAKTRWTVLPPDLKGLFAL